jgi:hypothetical protein
MPSVIGAPFRRLGAVALVGALAATAGGCEEKAGSKPPQSASNNVPSPYPSIYPNQATAYLNTQFGQCTSSDCPQASDLNIQPTGGQLAAIVGQSVSWQFVASSARYPTGSSSSSP